MKADLEVCFQCDNCWRGLNPNERMTCQLLSNRDGDDTLDKDTEIPADCPYKDDHVGDKE